jgi:uncharacterized protein (TIGR03382 family)
MRKLLTTAIALSFFLVATDGFARDKRVDQVPHGDTFSCGLCHTSDLGGGPRNAFGQQVENNLTEPGQAGDVIWEDVCPLDADGDGYSNGTELGDPNCTWQVGDQDPQAAVSEPGDPNDTLCGNGMIEEEVEECDGDNLGGSTCRNEQFEGGELDCASDCTFDFSGCEGSGPMMDAGMGNDAGMDAGMDTGGSNDPVDPSESACSATGAPAPAPLAILLFALYAVRRRNS